MMRWFPPMLAVAVCALAQPGAQQKMIDLPVVAYGAMDQPRDLQPGERFCLGDPRNQFEVRPES